MGEQPMEFLFECIITEWKQLKSKNEDKPGSFVVRFSYLGGKGYAFARTAPPDEVLESQKTAPVAHKFNLRFTEKGLYLWMRF